MPRSPPSEARPASGQWRDRLALARQRSPSRTQRGHRGPLCSPLQPASGALRDASILHVHAPSSQQQHGIARASHELSLSHSGSPSSGARGIRSLSVIHCLIVVCLTQALPASLPNSFIIERSILYLPAFWPGQPLCHTMLAACRCWCNASMPAHHSSGCSCRESLPRPSAHASCCFRVGVPNVSRLAGGLHGAQFQSLLVLQYRCIIKSGAPS